MTTASDLWQVLERIRDLPTLPTVAIKINALIGDEESPLDAIGSLIENDIALTARLLKLVNSSFFGLQSQVASIRRALVLLGLNQVRNAVYAVTVLDAVGRNGTAVQDMWRHGAAVAATAQLLAVKMKAPPACRENAFTAGLLHDIGKFIIWRHLPEISDHPIPSSISAIEAVHLLESSAKAIHHAEVGGYLASRWQLPESLRDAIHNHHQPSMAKTDIMLAALVHVADLVVHQIDLSAGGIQPGIPDPALPDEFRNCLDASPEWQTELAEHIDAAGQFFNKE